jgi:DNA-binding transcriptional regulator YiaG
MAFLSPPKACKTSEVRMELYCSMLQPDVKYALTGSALISARMETMGDRIRVLRESKGWTQTELAERLTARGAKVTFSAVSQWERGETQNIKLRLFLALVEELATTHEYLVHGPSDPASRDPTGKFRRLRGSTGNKA